MSLEKRIASLQNLDLNKITRDALRGKEDFIKRLNTIDQLFNQGIDADNIKLDTIGGPYTPFTVELKSNEAQPTDRITLKDTGDFYDTFIVTIGTDEIDISADTFKDGDDLRDRWGERIVGLTQESKDKLINEILPNTQEGIRNALR